MPICDKFVPLYTEYLDDQLPPSKKFEFDQHIHTCQECADTIRRMRVLTSQLQKMPAVTTSDSFFVVLKSRIRQELEKETLTERIINYIRAYRFPAFVTGAVAVLLLILISYSSFFQPNIQNISSTNLTTKKSAQESVDQMVTPSQDVFLVLEKVEKENIFSSKDILASERRREEPENMAVYYDSSRTHQRKPVGVVLAVPTSSVAF